MSDILARLQAAHSARPRIKVHVPEYGLDLYFPPLTLADHEAIRKGINPRDEHALMVAGLIHQAQLEDGSQAFPATPEVKAELHRIDMEVLARILGEASGGPGSAAQRELDTIPPQALRAMLTGLVPAGGALSAAIEAASDEALVMLLYRLAADHQARVPTKNG